MQIIPSGKVQTSFGEIADIAKSGEPVTITQYGRPTLLLIRYQDGIEVLREMAGKRIASVFDERSKKAPKAAKKVSLKSLNTEINEAR